MSNIWPAILVLLLESDNKLKLESIMKVYGGNLLIPLGYSSILKTVYEMNWKGSVLGYEKDRIAIGQWLFNRQGKVNRCVHVSETCYEVVNNRTPPSPHLSQYIQNLDLKVEKTFIDVHPYFALEKIMGYVQLRYSELPKNLRTSVFKMKKSCFSERGDFTPTPFLPFLSELRKTYLKEEKHKLRVLPRKRKATPEEQQEAVRKWTEWCNFHQLTKDLHDSQFDHAAWAYSQYMQNKSSLIRQVDIQALRENKVRLTYHAHW